MRFLKLITFIFIINVAEGQVVINKTINIHSNKIFADKFDNFYVLTDDAFIKYNSLGKKIATFHPEGGEEISSVDVRNPFKIILFFSEQNKVLLLDNNLTKISTEISLSKYDIYGDALISTATIGGYWIFNNVKSQLLKLSSDFKLEYIKDINTNSRIISITDNSTNVFLLKNSGDLMGFNYNTSQHEYLSIYKLNENFKVEDNDVIHYSSNNHSLKIQNLLDNNVSYIKFPPKIYVKGATIGNSKIFFFDKLKVYISSVNFD